GVSSTTLADAAQLDLAERLDRLLETRFTSHGERLLVGLAHLLVRHALLEAIVPGHEKLLDALARVVGHRPSVPPSLLSVATLARPCRGFRSQRSSRYSLRRGSSRWSSCTREGKRAWAGSASLRTLRAG